MVSCCAPGCIDYWSNGPYHVTYPANFVFCFNNRRGTIKCSVFFQKICFFVQYFDHLRVPELIIKSVEGLNLVSDKELFIGTVNGTENVGFAKWLTTVLPDSWTRGPEAGVSSLIRSHSYF